MFVRSSGIAAAVVLASISTAASAGILSQYNLIVTRDLDSTSEVEGRTFVGRNLSGPASNYAIRLDQNAFQGVDTLIVGGNITAQNVNLQAGNLRRGGTRTGNANFNGVGGHEIVDASVATLGASFATQLVNDSNFFRSFTSNSNVSVPTGQPGPVVFTAAPSGPNNVAVFSINGNQVLHNQQVQQLELNLNGASAVLINVAGTTVNFDQGNFVGAWNNLFTRSNVLWNFYEATSITISRQFNGAILAPHAMLTNFSPIEGSVFVRDMTMRAEVHLPGYADNIPSPGTVAPLAAAGVLAFRRRRAA